MENKIKLYKKINKIRVELSNILSKGGKNDYAKFKYFQLQDFMPKVLELCDNSDLFTKFYINKEKVELPVVVTEKFINEEIEKTSIENFEYREYGYLEIMDLETGYIEVFKKETKEANVSGASAIQNVGAKSTYMKRYMYMDVFEINESDEVDGDTKKNGKVETKTVVTPKVEPSKVAVEKVESKPMPPKEEPKVEVPKSEPITTNANTPLSKASKQELVNLIKAKGKDPKSTLEQLCAELGKSLTGLVESDKNILEEKINELGE